MRFYGNKLSVWLFSTCGFDTELLLEDPSSDKWSLAWKQKQSLGLSFHLVFVKATGAYGQLKETHVL